MEFFDLFSFVNTIMQVSHGGFSFPDLWISIGVGGGLFLICLVFGGLGLYVMASRRGMKCPWLGFLPFANTYYAGEVAGEANFFGQKMKRHGLYAMLLEMLYVAVNVFSLVVQIFLINPAYYETVVNADGTEGLRFNSSLVPAQYQWVVTADMWLQILTSLVFIVMVIFMCVVYYALYRKYYMRGPFMMTFLSVILPFRGIVLFAVRKNTPVDYNEVMRKRMEAMYRAQNPDYRPRDDAGGNASPFSEFGGSDRPSGKTEDSPFSEFDDFTDHKNE